jgi:O-succinylbenzoic acid--CoA ligase
VPRPSPTGEIPLVAAPLAGRALARATWDAWERGEAILPLNPATPAAESARLLEQLRPTHLFDGGERSRVRGGVPVAGDVVAVMVTSGTTGEAKGVELTGEGRTVMGRGYSKGVGATADDCWLACLPLHHVASLGVLARSFVTGVPYLVHDGLDLARVARAPRDEGATIVSVVPTVLFRLLEAGAPLHEYRCIIVGGAPCPPSLRARAEADGARIVDAYGLTETWSGWTLDGVPIEGAQARLDVDGELLVRGAMVMRGYRLDPARTAEALTPDGWLRTGDIAEITDGRVRVVDRKKDLVISGGVNVSPTEVEGVLLHHPLVADVCVIGVADEEWGERVVAYVVAAGERPPTLDELRAFGREQLAAPKLPRELRLVDEIPRSGSGKPLRRLLRNT